MIIISLYEEQSPRLKKVILHLIEYKVEIVISAMSCPFIDLFKSMILLQTLYLCILFTFIRF